jgi:hypothetical protein
MLLLLLLLLLLACHSSSAARAAADLRRGPRCSWYKDKARGINSSGSWYTCTTGHWQQLHEHVSCTTANFVALKTTMQAPVEHCRQQAYKHTAEPVLTEKLACQHWTLRPATQHSLNLTC